MDTEATLDIIITLFPFSFIGNWNAGFFFRHG
jgi:hypothetical protein